MLVPSSRTSVGSTGNAAQAGSTSSPGIARAIGNSHADSRAQRPARSASRLPGRTRTSSVASYQSASRAATATRSTISGRSDSHSTSTSGRPTTDEAAYAAVARPAPEGPASNNDGHSPPLCNRAIQELKRARCSAPIINSSNGQPPKRRSRIPVGRLMMLLGRYGGGNGDFVLVGSQAASLRPTASRSWSRSSTRR
jgi:hypothetical protein